MPSETLDRDTALSENTAPRRAAVAWAVLFGAGTTLAKKVGERYLMGEKMRLEWSDLTTVAVSAAASYVSFRRSHDDDFPLG